MIPKLSIRNYGDPVLRKKALPVKTVGPSERLLIKAMLATMYESKGVGLAAPQVGISQKIFVVDDGEGQGPFAVINPKIIKRSIASAKMQEGCLSIPGVQVDVRRPAEIWVEYLDENGQKVERHLKELLARVFQHENDHLLGKLIIDHATLAQKALLRPQLNELKKRAKS